MPEAMPMNNVEQEPAMDASASYPEVPISKEAFGSAMPKVGDTMTFKVTKVEGDNILVQCVDSQAEKPMNPDEMSKMSEDEAMKMPLDKLESRLPKSEER